MKKIYLVSTIFTLIGIVFLLEPEWFKFLWGWQILLLPIAAGISLVFVQKESKSFKFIPKLVIGSILIGVSFSVFTVIIDHIKYNVNYKIAFVDFIYGIFTFSLSLATVCFFGGLIGIALSGIYILLIKKQKI